MKNIVLASVLASVTTAFAVPAIAGPVHFAVTRPYSLYAWVPPIPATGSSTLTLGTLPLDFVLTDVVNNCVHTNLFVLVNGQRVLCCEPAPSRGTHLNSGIFVPAGSTIGVERTHAGGTTEDGPVTLTGYVQ